MYLDYKEYASSQYSGLWTAPAIQMISAAMVRAYCHKVIKLSDALQTYAPEKECTSNVHGVRAEFLQQGLALSSIAMQQQQQDRKANNNNNATAVTLASSSQPTAASESSNRAYFIGKLLWAKGLDLMLDLEDYYRQCTGKYFAVDIYGNGPDEEDIKRAFHGRQYINGTLKSNTATNSAATSSSSETTIPPSNGATTDLLEGALPFLALPENLEAMAKQQLAKLPRTFSELRRQPIPATFPGRVDHAELKQYKIFVNPSISEVLCTTTAEALAMGKFVIIPVHPSNTFFLKFPNCLAYRSKFEFVANLRWALTHEPEPLTMSLAREFTWEAATDRLVQHAAITRKEALERERLGMSKLDQRIAWFHNELGKGMTGDMLRKIFGAGPASQQVQYQLRNEQAAAAAAAAASLSKQDQDDKDDLLAAKTTTTEKAAADAEDEGDIDDDETKEDQDDGLSRKFRRSSFAEAMRTALGDLSSFVIQ
jgi:digalactosyldiacylglycerol synthase